MISFKNVSYKIKDKVILSSITFNIKRGEKVLLMGSSGSGKTTIFNLLLKNIKLTSGIITYEKKDINDFNEIKTQQYRKNHIICILQKDDLFDNLTVIENLTLFYYEKDAINLLSKANLIKLKDRYVYNLSGGERQRVAIIKACLSNGNVLLCDEITSALDEENAKLIIDFILKLFKDKTIIFICHDKNLLINKVDHYLYLENGKIKDNIILNDINKYKYKENIDKSKSLYNVSFKQSIKKVKISSFIILLLSIICFYMSFYFKDVFDYIATNSYKKYIDYNVLLIKDNLDIIVDINNNIYPSIDNILNQSEVVINNIKISSFKFTPYISNDSNIILVNDKLTNKYSINNISSVSINSNKINENISNCLLINEDNMFSTPTIYYDIKYFYKYYDDSLDNNLYILNYDFTNLDNRFTNNPLYETKKEEKPYLENNAYLDYLTYKMVFDSIYMIVNYFFTISLVFIIIISILINISLIIKDKKQIAIYISRGYKDIQIMSFYLLPLLIYIIVPFALSIYHNKLIKPLLYSFIIQLSCIVISYYLLKKKSLNDLLKSEHLS